MFMIDKHSAALYRLYYIAVLRTPYFAFQDKTRDCVHQNGTTFGMETLGCML